VQVDARGEVAELKDYINTMIDNLRLTTERNTEQDWLKTNLARFTSMLQGQPRSLDRRQTKLLSDLVPLVNAQQGLIYQMLPEDERPISSFWRSMPTITATVFPRELELAKVSSASALSKSAASRSTSWAKGCASVPTCWMPRRAA